MLALAFVAIVIAVVSWSIGTALLLWASRLRRLEAQAAGGPSAADLTSAATDLRPDGIGPDGDPETVEDACKSIAAGLGDVELRETALMLTALAEHGRVMVASRDPGREELARRVVGELADRSAGHGLGPPITASDGEVVGAAVFRATEGLGEPLRHAAEWELAVRTTAGAPSRDPAH